MDHVHCSGLFPVFLNANYGVVHAARHRNAEQTLKVDEVLSDFETESEQRATPWSLRRKAGSTRWRRPRSEPLWGSFSFISLGLLYPNHIRHLVWHQLYKLPSFRRSQRRPAFPRRAATWKASGTSFRISLVVSSVVRRCLRADAFLSSCSLAIVWFPLEEPRTVPDYLELLPLYSRYLECLSSNSR